MINRLNIIAEQLSGSMHHTKCATTCLEPTYVLVNYLISPYSVRISSADPAFVEELVGTLIGQNEVLLVVIKAPRIDRSYILQAILNRGRREQ
jgi:hypothetical protein